MISKNNHFYGNRFPVVKATEVKLIPDIVELRFNGHGIGIDYEGCTDEEIELFERLFDDEVSLALEKLSSRKGD